VEEAAAVTEAAAAAATMLPRMGSDVEDRRIGTGKELLFEE
jgi:hypothetical protein